MIYPPDAPDLEPTPPRSERLAGARRGVRRASGFTLGVAAALVAVALYGFATPAPKPLTKGDVAVSIASALASVTPGPALSQLAYQRVQPSLVLVSATGTGPATGDNGSASSSSSPGAAGSATPGGSPAPGGPLPSSSALPGISTAAAPGISTAAGPTGTQGSGVIIDTAGDIMTCLHIVQNATSIEVTFADGSTSTAQIATADATNDIAVLQPDRPPSQITPAVLGNPRSIAVGSEAYVLGSPFGLYGSFSAGVVSGLNRTFQLANGTQLTGMIQVDAAVNPGNSGGPLVNRYGQVVGIVSGIVNPTNQSVFIGIGFAVPIDVAGGAAGLPRD
jgi:S1-C subfamily serine protease